MRGIRVRRLAGAPLDEESGKVITDHIAGLEALLLGRHQEAPTDQSRVLNHLTARGMAWIQLLT